MMNNIYNIYSNYHFLNSLKYLILDLAKKHPEKINNISNLIIYLPSRRSVREFKKILALDNNFKTLPKIKAILDINYEDFFQFLPNSEVRQEIDEILNINSLSKLNYIFYLMHQIQDLAIFGRNLNFNQNFKIASNICDLFEEIEKNEVKIEKLAEIDDSNLSKHRLLTLDFIKEFHIKVKNSLIKNNILSHSSYQNLIIQKYAKCLENFGSKNPIIIAGSTGSISYGKKLIKAISKDNFVVLNNYFYEENYEENHPQYFNNSLVKHLGVSNITNFNHSQLTSDSRQQLLDLITSPNKEIYDDEFSKDIKDNFTIITAKNELDEAKIIKLNLIDSLNNNKKCAIITNNNDLVNLLKLELQSSDIAFNDSRNLDVSNSNLLNFILLLIKTLENNFESHSLLALLKNKLFFLEINISDFEINIVRNKRKEDSIKGLQDKLLEFPDLKKSFDEFYNLTKPLLNLLSKPQFYLNELFEVIFKVVENISSQTINDLLKNEEAKEEISKFFHDISQEKLLVANSNIYDLASKLFSQISYFKRSDSDSNIQILSTIEARLLNFDLIILASLNENDFPQIQSDNWLGGKIKKDLEIDNNVKKIGQNAFDFCNYLSNKSVILSRHKQKNNRILLESPFLLKFQLICKKLGLNIDKTQFFEDILIKEQLSNINFKETTNYNIKLDKSEQFKEISISDITRLIKNPYEFYLKKILKLKPLDEIDPESGNKEFGSFVHKVLEIYVKENKNESKKIFHEFFSKKEDELVWLAKFENIFNNFIEDNQKYASYKNLVEKALKTTIKDIKVTGIIDRIAIKDDNIEIIDYKTGAVPSKKDVLSIKEPQLLICALLVLDNIAKESEKITKLEYLKLSAYKDNQFKEILTNKEEILSQIAMTKSFLENLFDYFYNNHFFATINDEKSDYQNLIRKEEWSIATN